MTVVGVPHSTGGAAGGVPQEADSEVAVRVQEDLRSALGVRSRGGKKRLGPRTTEKLGCGAGRLWEVWKLQCPFTIAHAGPLGAHSRQSPGAGSPGGDRHLEQSGSWRRGNSRGAPTAGGPPSGLQHFQQLGNKFFHLEGQQGVRRTLAPGHNGLPCPWERSPLTREDPASSRASP